MIEKNINKNMLRPRKNKEAEVTKEQLESINKENLFVFNEFIDSSSQLSIKTIKQYKSAIGQFLYFVKTELNDKKITQISKRDFLKYIGHLTKNGMSSNGIANRKAAVSSMLNFIENVLSDELEEYKGFRSFARGLPKLAKNKTYEKLPISREEYEMLMKVLEEKNDYIGMSYLSMGFNCGARKGELRQLKTEILGYEFENGKKYKISHVCRGKGKSLDGKPIRFMINEEALKYAQLYIDKREFESEYIFAIKHKGKISVISETWANDFCKRLEPYIGKRLHPHMLRSSCVTFLLNNGKDMEEVSKFICNHESVETTKGYDLRKSDNKNSLFD